MERKIKEYKKLLSKNYPEVRMQKVAARIIDQAAKTAAKQAGFKAISKTILKKAAKFIPAVLAGMVLNDVVRKISALIKDNKSESNVIPYGEFYHKDTGWY